MMMGEVLPDPPCGATLPRVLRWAAETYADRELFVLGERRISFAEAERQSAELARGLLASGVGKGTRIGILMENAPDWPLCFFAAARVGALTVSLSTFYQAPEVDWALRHNDIDTLLVTARYLKTDYAELLERALPGLSEQQGPAIFLPSHPYLRRIIVFGECDRPWALRGPQRLHDAAAANPRVDEAFLQAVEDNVAPADDLLIICTSGSTSEPKAVLHTHGVCVRAAYEFLDYMDLRPGDRSYTGQPFFWIGGINVNLMPTLFQGGTMCFAPSPRPDDILDVIERERVTRLSLWPAQTHGLREVAAGRDMSSIRTGWSEPVDPLGNVIPADRRMGGVMGMTESFGMHSIDRIYMPTPVGQGGHWGRHTRGVERRIVDPETRQPRPAGQEGELLIRGCTLMRGYYKKEREEAFTIDGWFATGDLAVIDNDDYIYFTGRRGEMVKTAGANVAPREVELALMAHPQVREAVVFGMPDPVKGEKVVAVLVPRAGDLDTEAVAAWLKQQISAYKAPAEFHVMPFEAIPRTGSQKPIKARLKSILMGEDSSDPPTS